MNKLAVVLERYPCMPVAGVEYAYQSFDVCSQRTGKLHSTGFFVGTRSECEQHARELGPGNPAAGLSVCVVEPLAG
jgi:hypothetical protein